MSNTTHYLIVISGPTAVGKTGLAVQLAHHYHTAVLSSDSRQIFKEMSIGTAKPSKEEMQNITHFFIDHVSIHDRPVYDAAQFERDAIALLDTLFQKYRIVIMAGGSGLYVDAVLNGLDDIPNASESLRQELSEEIKQYGLGKLLQELENKDPKYYKAVDKANPRRVQRAIEVIRTTGKPFSSFRKGETKTRNFKTIHIGLEREREELYQRINRRMDLMLEQGLEEEAKHLYPFKQLNALQTVGYKEVFDFFEGKYSREEMIEKLKQHTRQYAKRQMTWLKKDETIRWFHPDKQEQIILYLDKIMEKKLS